MPFESSFETLLEDAREAAALGYDSIWLGESHSSRSSYPSPLLALSWFASSVKQVKIGTSVLLLPMYHPVRLAEETALLDVMSGGRLILGVGLGGTRFREDFASYGIECKGRISRFKEQLAIMRKLWTGEAVSHSGRFYRIEGAKLAFSPVQRTGPPIWIGARTEVGTRLAAGDGDAFLPGPSIPMSALSGFYGIYDEAIKVGEPRRSGERPLMRETTISQNAEDSRKDDAVVTEYFTKSYLKAPSVRSMHDPDLGKLPANTFIRGDPESCIEYVEEYLHAFSITHMILRFRFAGMSDEKVRSKMRLFAEKVIPQFA